MASVCKKNAVERRMKHAPYKLLLALTLGACSANPGSTLSEATDSPAFPADAPLQIAEADFENQFQWIDAERSDCICKSSSLQY